MWFRKDRARVDVDQELSFHLEKEIELNSARGMSPEEARRQALIAFGGVQQTQEAVRAVGWRHIANTFLQDVRYGARMLRKSPGFAAVALVTLALGIGANTAIFSVVSSVLYPSWGLRNPQQLVVVREATANNKGFMISVPDFEDYRRQQSTFSHLSLWISQSINLTGQERPDRLVGSYVSDNFFEMLGTKAVRGRTFLPGEDQPGADRVALVGYSAWQKRFGADATILGRSLTLNNEIYTVVGVLPRNLEALVPVDVYVTAQHHTSYKVDRQTQPLLMFGRIKDGVSRSRAVADLDSVAQRLAREFPASNAGTHIEVDTLREMFTGSLRDPMLLLLAAVAVVLLIVCANLANLLLARGMARQREIAVRAALGAARVRLLRQLLAESLLIAVLGGIAGIALAVGLLQVLLKIGPVQLSLNPAAVLDLRVLVFTAAVSVLTGLLFGAAPAMQFSRVNLSSALAAGNRQAGHSSRPWLRSAFVIGQLAMSMALLINAALLVKSFRALLDASPGFVPDHLLSMEYRIPKNKYVTPEAQINFHLQVLEQVRRVPGVVSATYVMGLPFSGNWGQVSFTLPGRPAAGNGVDLTALGNTVAPEYFSTLGIPLLQGRVFSAHDDAHSQPVAIISRTFAEKLLVGQDPLGQRVQITNNSVALVGPTPNPTLAIVIGVVGDARQVSRRESSQPQIYFSYAQSPNIFGTLAVRTAGEPMNWSDAVRAAVWSVDKDQPVWKIRTVEYLMQRDVASDRFVALLISAFGALALLLSALGTYGMLSHVVHQRVRELGVRMALGATSASVLKLVMWQGLKLTAVGGVIGLACAFAATRLVRSLLFGVSPADTASFVIGWIFVTLIAVAACYFPARRATRVDPMVALRNE
jgi:putative ABC transport system permease protein